MKLNTLKPQVGATKVAKRVGRGIGSGLGKTCGRGHKGQKSRSGAPQKVIGFEGGQMPLQRRLPKFGFRSHIAKKTAEIRLRELNKVDGDDVNMTTLRKAGVISNAIKYAKIILSGELKKKVNVSGVRVTRGAREAIVAAGGKVEE